MAQDQKSSDAAPPPHVDRRLCLKLQAAAKCKRTAAPLGEKTGNRQGAEESFASGLEIRERRTKLQLSDIEISEQKMKVPLPAFDAHSISDSSARADEEPKSGKVFVKFVKIMITLDLQSLLLNSGGGSGAEPITQTIETDNIMSKTACFKQIRRENKEKSDSELTGDLTEMFTLYDIVRVDGVESRESDVKLHSEIEESRLQDAYCCC